MPKELQDRSITMRAARTNAGMTLEEAADKLRVSRYRLSRWENYVTDVPLYIAWQMAELYKIPIQLLKPGAE